MTKNKNKKKAGEINHQGKKQSVFELPERIKRIIWGILFFLIAIITAFSFFDMAGLFGKGLMKALNFLVGKTVFITPFIFALSGLVFLRTRYKKFLFALILAILLLIFGISGIFGSIGIDKTSSFSFANGENAGGWIGYALSLYLLKLFGFWVAQILSGGMILIGCLIFWQLLKTPLIHPVEPLEEMSAKPSLIKRIFATKFQVKEIEPGSQSIAEESTSRQETAEIPSATPLDKASLASAFKYEPPPLDLLEAERGAPSSGDTRVNSAIIKKTLQNFDIPVEMSEINIGPTVAQYTLKPAEGVKLSKITGLANDLSLALASHPIRIEAPIPGRSLVGIEIPNKVRARVRLRNLLSHPNFQNSQTIIPIALGKDVSGLPLYADLAKMPHLLVAGSTGTGKTCAADTLMFTERGILTFEELCPLPLNSETDFKIRVVTRDGIETTSKNYNNGICQFYKLSTSRGYQIEATLEHPLWVMNEDGSQSWKQASLIKEGDFAAISRGPGLFGSKIDLSNFRPSKIKVHHRKISFPQRMTPQLAQFLGLLTADGGLSIERKGLHRVTYTQADPHLIRLYKKSLKELFGITQFIEKRSGSNPKNRAFDIVIGSKHLKEFLAYLGMDSCRSPQKEMPRAIREAPKEIVTAYLRALFDNDGYMGENSIELVISSKKLISQIHIMLLNFGIISSLNVKKVKNYADNDYYRLSIFGQESRQFIQEIGFIRKEKHSKAKKFLKLSPNPNVDLIPHISNLIKTLGQKYLNRFARLTNRGWRYQSGILVPKHAFSSLMSYNSGFRTPGYQGLERILDFYQPISEEPEYQELEKISKRNFYWDKIKKIDRTSGVGYDFYVPGSDSFVGNGFVNHNTIFLNSILLSLLYKNSPETIRLVLVDPKRVEFSVYQGLPHLLSPVIYNANLTCNALKWLIGEMERRFDVLSEAKARDIDGFNEIAHKTQSAKEEYLRPLPYIVLIIDELADLMAAKGREIEAGVVRLAQMARAVGIHLIVATQRPSVEVITGLIKANITSRVTFQVASQVDSRTVIDMAGAEKLLGSGDLLYISAEIAKPRRIQGAYVSEKEVRKVVNWIKAKDKGPDFAGETFENGLAIDLEKNLRIPEGETEGAFSEDEPLYEEAKRIAIEARKASASLFQRRLRVGYARAARILDLLEERGIVGPGEGAKPREVFINTEEGEDGWKKT